MTNDTAKLDAPPRATNVWVLSLPGLPSTSMVLPVDDSRPAPPRYDCSAEAEDLHPGRFLRSDMVSVARYVAGNCVGQLMTEQHYKWSARLPVRDRFQKVASDAASPSTNYSTTEAVLQSL